jgi:pimeloyl-ACP methyl ester carboxylesterase
MTADTPQFVTVGTGAAERRIAVILERPAAAASAPAARPGLMWLPGFKSEMTSLKATALAELARRQGLAMTRLDYSGHGCSPGRVEDGSVSRWLDEVRHVFCAETTGPQIVVGSSMGGYLALLLLRALQREAPAEAARIEALVLIAPAWDMTRLMWERMSASARRDVETIGVYWRPSEYGDGPYPITRAMLDDGRRHWLADAPFDPGRPVHILHGLLDPDVPWEHTLDLVAHLSGDWTTVDAVPDGDHRLSRPEDLALLERIVTRLTRD